MSALSLFPETEVMWAAGFFEGEGSVGKGHLHVHQVNLWPLTRLMKTFGGTLVRKPRRPANPRQQPIYQWVISGPRGRNFVAAIYPHLSPKRQAQIDRWFVTWDKFVTRTEKQKAHFYWMSSNRDPATGKFRKPTTPKLRAIEGGK
jgi:hypothetical protein